MRRTISSLTTPLRNLAAAIAFLSGASMTSAQVPDAPPAPPPEATPVPPEAAPLQDEKLNQFADAYLAIEEIEQQATVELSEAQDPQAASQIKQMAEEQIIRAVERSGLQLDEFNQIAELAAVDEALRMKLADKVQRRRRI